MQLALASHVVLVVLLSFGEELSHGLFGRTDKLREELRTVHVSDAEVRIGHSPDLGCLVAKEGLTGTWRSVQEHAAVDDAHAGEPLLQDWVELGQEQVLHHELDLACHASEPELLIPGGLRSLAFGELGDLGHDLLCLHLFVL